MRNINGAYKNLKDYSFACVHAFEQQLPDLMDGDT